jgi:galactose mutarotase-like enzyme
MRQFAGAQPAVLPNGMRFIQAYNTSGLRFSVLPDRGLDIWRADYQGVPLTWLSRGAPYPPDFGQTWLQQFNGGLLTTCGLTHVGPPEHQQTIDSRGGIHGPYSRLRADAVTYQSGWTTADAYHVEIAAEIAQAGLFAEQLVLVRTYTFNLTDPVVHLTDTVTNLGDAAAPLMVLYHVNLGYPLLSDGSQLVVSSTVYPRDNTARAGLAMWDTYAAATPGYTEQVFFHHLKLSNSIARVALVNGDFGLSLEWDSRQMPYLSQWKYTRQGTYVAALEPGNCIPEGQHAARENGRLRMLQPGNTACFQLRIAVLDSAEAVNALRDAIHEALDQGAPISACKLDDYA